MNNREPKVVHYTLVLGSDPQIELYKFQVIFRLRYNLRSKGRRRKSQAIRH